MWLPDTNVWIAYLRKKPSPVHLRISNLPESQLWLCDVVKAELYFGAFKSARSAENLERLERLFSILPSVPFDSAAARQFGEIRAYLSRRGMPIGPYDLQIAAIAALHDFTLVTHNIGFEKKAFSSPFTHFKSSRKPVMAMRRGKSGALFWCF